MSDPTNIHNFILNQHPEYGENILQLSTDHVIASLHRHPERPAWLWCVSAFDSRAGMTHMDTRREFHGYSGSDKLLVGFGVLPPDTILAIAETHETVPQPHLVFSLEHRIYICVFPASIPTKIHFIDVNGVTRYTIDRLMSWLPAPTNAWREQLCLRIRTHPWLARFNQPSPEQLRHTEEMMRKFNTYEED